jgi:hypothetical protein
MNVALAKVTISKYVSNLHATAPNFHSPNTTNNISVVMVMKQINKSPMARFIMKRFQLLIFVQTVEKYLPDGRIKYSCSSSGYNAEWQRKLYFTFMTSYILVIPAFIISK